MIKQITISNLACRHCKQDIIDVLSTYSCIKSLRFVEDILEIEFIEEMDDKELIETIENCGNFHVTKMKRI